ncbi:MAG TPA: CARDB domain-containing protein, partial [Humisphaera sp.]
FVVFTSDAGDLSVGDTNNKDDIFISDIPEPVGGSDTTAPTATFGALEAVSPGATKVRFTVNLSDNAGLNTVALGNLSVTKAGGGSFTATKVGVVGTGLSAVATYEVDFGSPVESNFGTYTITVPSQAIRDAAGNQATTIAGGSFTLAAPGSGGTGGGVVGDPNGPDLVVTTIGKISASAIGTVTKGKVKFKVSNAGPGLMSVPASYTVYLSADATQDAADVPLATVTKTLKLKVGKAKSLSAKWVYPGGIGDGNYFVIVKADTANNVAESNETNNSLASATTVLVQAPFVDLQPTTISKPSNTVAGGISTVTVVVKNNGNVAYKGAAGLNIVVVPETAPATPIDASARVLGSFTSSLSLKPGKTKTLKFKVTNAADLAAGNYQYGVIVDPTNVIAEKDESNNAAASFVFTV